MKRLIAAAALCLPLIAFAEDPVEIVTWDSGVSYAYDSSGNIQQAGKDSFAYDHVGRLVQANVNGIRRNYEYDAYGNRTKCLQNGGTTLAGDCQVYGIRPSDNRIEGAGYDAAGNVSSLGTHTYTYDAFNQMTRDQSGDSREFLYTAGGQRVATYQVGANAWRWTIRDQDDHVLRELTSSGGAHGTSSFEWVKDYVWREGLLLATTQPEALSTTVYHYHLDHLGSPRRITDARDNVVGFHDFLAYGPEERGKEEPSTTRLRYAGSERDRANDPFGTLDYMLVRYYNPALGRFFSPDPVISPRAVRMPQNWNRYAYALGNPLIYVDPNGLDIILHACVSDPSSAACHDQLEATKKALGPAWKHFDYNGRGIITLKKGVSPHWLGRVYGPTAHVLGFMANSRDHFTLVADAKKAAQGNGAYTFTLPGGGAHIYYDPAKFGGGRVSPIADVMAGLAEVFVHEAGHAIEPYFNLQDINDKYAGKPEIAWRREVFPVFLQNHWRRAILGIASPGDVRTYYNTPGDIVHPGTKLETIWP